MDRSRRAVLGVLGACVLSLLGGCSTVDDGVTETTRSCPASVTPATPATTPPSQLRYADYPTYPATVTATTSLRYAKAFERTYQRNRIATTKRHAISFQVKSFSSVGDHALSDGYLVWFELAFAYQLSQLETTIHGDGIVAVTYLLRDDEARRYEGATHVPLHEDERGTTIYRACPRRP